MPYYHTCPMCGATLDPGETCDCSQVQSTTSSFSPETKRPRTDESDAA